MRLAFVLLVLLTAVPAALLAQTRARGAFPPAAAFRAPSSSLLISSQISLSTIGHLRDGKRCIIALLRGTGERKEPGNHLARYGCRGS